MSSTLTNYSINIDTTFPVPGQDNDTQGFRDNFIAIKGGLETAASEITDLQVVQSGIISQLGAPITFPTNYTGTSVTASYSNITTGTFETINSTNINAASFTGSGNGLTFSSLYTPQSDIDSLTINNSLVVNSTSTFNTSTVFNGSVTINGILTVTTQHIIASTITTVLLPSTSIENHDIGLVTPKTGTFTDLTGDTLTITGSAVIGGGLQNTGNLENIGNLNIVGGASISNTLDISGVTRITDITPSTSPITGALKIAGGVGVGGNLCVSHKILAGTIKVETSGDSTSPTTGALQVAGGVGVSKSLYVGGTINASSIFVRGVPVSTITPDLTPYQNAVTIYHNNGTVGPLLTIPVDYTYGRYQKLKLDTSGLTQSNIKITNWPALGIHGSIQVELEFQGTSAFTSGGSIESRSSCTTYGSVSSTVDITDLASDGSLAGVGVIRPGWGVYTNNQPLSTKIGTVVSILSKTRLSIDTGYQFDWGTNFYFAPTDIYAATYTVDIDVGSGIKKINTNLGYGTYTNVTVDTSKESVVYDLYTYDGGNTVFVKNISVYQ